MTELKTLKDFAWKNRDTEHKDRLFENDLLLKELRLEAIKWAKALKNKTEVGKNCGPIICQGCVTGGTMITAQIDGDGVPAALSTDNYELVSFLKVFFNLSEDDLK